MFEHENAHKIVFTMILFIILIHFSCLLKYCWFEHENRRWYSLTLTWKRSWKQTWNRIYRRSEHENNMKTDSMSIQCETNMKMYTWKWSWKSHENNTKITWKRTWKRIHRIQYTTEDENNMKTYSMCFQLENERENRCENERKECAKFLIQLRQKCSVKVNWERFECWWCYFIQVQLTTNGILK